MFLFPRVTLFILGLIYKGIAMSSTLISAEWTFCSWFFYCLACCLDVSQEEDEAKPVKLQVSMQMCPCEDSHPQFVHHTQPVNAAAFVPASN